LREKGIKSTRPSLKRRGKTVQRLFNQRGADLNSKDTSNLHQKGETLQEEEGGNSNANRLKIVSYQIRRNLCIQWNEKKKKLMRKKKTKNRRKGSRLLTHGRMASFFNPKMLGEGGGRGRGGEDGRCFSKRRLRPICT